MKRLLFACQMTRTGYLAFRTSQNRSGGSSLGRRSPSIPKPVERVVSKGLRLTEAFGGNARHRDTGDKNECQCRRQAITKIGGGLSRLVSTAGLTSASTQPSTISDAAKRNVGRAYKQDARALGANHPRAKPVGVEPTTAEQTARNASPVPRTPEQVPPQRRVVDRVPILPEVRPVSGDRGATMLGSPPPQVLAEAPKRPVDVMINFVPTIMPTAPCQEQRSEGEPQTNDDMPAPWK